MSVLFQTKLFAPAVERNFVARPRLVESLASESRCRLILVSAPAGAGKTTLISSWIRETSGCAAWLSLDEQDSNPHEFLMYVIAALRSLRSNAGEKALSLLQVTPPVSPETIVGVLINDLIKHGDSGVLVLDDYHTIEDAEVHRLMSFLIKQIPPSIVLVIISRTDPPLPLARLRARGELCEIREADLRFRSEEAAMFIECVCGRQLNPEAVSALTKRVEGWAVGLQLAALALRRASDPEEFVSRFAGTHEYVADYLTDEVFSGLSEEQQNFLMQTSVLRRLTGSACNALTGGTNGHEVLESMSRANLFLIPLDESRTWFRFHHLFRDLLRRRCRQRFGDRYSDLLNRASLWAEGANLWDEAIGYAHEGGDLQRQAVLTARYGIQALSLGMVVKVLGWLDALPDHILWESPDLCLLVAYSSNLMQRHERLSDYIRQAELLLIDGRRPHPEIEVIESHVELMAAGVEVLNGSATEEIEPRLRRARDELRPQDVLLRSIADIIIANSQKLDGHYSQACDSYQSSIDAAIDAKSTLMELLASVGRAETLLLMGDLRGVAAVCQTALDHINIAVGEAMNAEVGILYALRALVQHERGEVEQSQRSLDQAMSIFQPAATATENYSLAGLIKGPASAVHSTSFGVFLSLIALVRILVFRGKVSTAEACLEETEGEIDNLVGRATVDALKIRIWMAKHDVVAARNWLRTGPSIEITPIFWSQLSGLTHARALIMTGDHLESLALLDRVIQAARVAGTRMVLIEGLLLRAAACHACARQAEAVSLAAQALELSSAGAHVRTWLDEGEYLLPLLETVVSARDTSPAITTYAIGLIRDLRSEIASRRNNSSEGLSERELEVLALMAQGYVNREIADRLFVAVGTVKKHTHAIYQKLDVSNRTQAIRRAQKLRLL